MKRPPEGIVRTSETTTIITAAVREEALETEIITVEVREDLSETETTTVEARVRETLETEIITAAVREEALETETTVVREELLVIKTEETAEITEDRDAAREETVADVPWLSQRSQASR